jgi:hypothetical protein
MDPDPGGPKTYARSATLLGASEMARKRKKKNLILQIRNHASFL